MLMVAQMLSCEDIDKKCGSHSVKGTPGTSRLRGADYLDHTEDGSDDDQ